MYHPSIFTTIDKKITVAITYSRSASEAWAKVKKDMDLDNSDLDIKRLDPGHIYIAKLK